MKTRLTLTVYCKEYTCEACHQLNCQKGKCTLFGWWLEKNGNHWMRCEDCKEAEQKTELIRKGEM